MRVPLGLVLILLAAALAPAALGGDSEPAPAQNRPFLDKVFYLQTSDTAKNVGAVATRNFFQSTPGSMMEEIQSRQRIIAEWYLFPELAGSVRLEGDARLVVWYKSTDVGATVSWDVDFDRVLPDGTLQTITSLASLTSAPATNPATYEERTITFPVDTAIDPLLPGEAVRLRINVRGNNANDYFLAWGDATYDSRLVLPTEDYVRAVPAVENGIWTTDSQLAPRSNFDPAAADKNIYLYATITDPFGGYDLVWVNLTVRDPSGTVVPALDDVPMTRVEGFFNSFTSVYRVPWNYAGQPNGLYNITVTALDQTGWREFLATGDAGDHLQADWGAFSIGLPPLSVWVHVLDLAGDDAAGVRVEARFGNTVVTSGTTAADGFVELLLAPGTYQFVALWTGVVVGSRGDAISSDVPRASALVINASIISPTIRVVDTANAPLERAAVVLQHPNGTVGATARLTDADGRVALTAVAGGSYNVSVQWRGKGVARVTLVMTANVVYTITAAVHYVTFRATDQGGLDVPDAFVIVSDPVYSLILDAGVTDADGEFRSRLPAGSFSVRATYFGVEVFAPAPLVVVASATFPLSLLIYDVTFTIHDSRNETLEGASVTIASPYLVKATNTGADGVVSFKLPAGTYTLSVVWRSVLVLDQGGWIVGPGGSTFTVGVAVYYLTATAKDRDGKELVGAHVTASSGGETFGAELTDLNGVATFRLPAGNYTVTARYRATSGFSEVNLQKTGTAQLSDDRTVAVTFPEVPLSALEQILNYLAIVYLILAVLATFFFWRARSRGVRA